MHASYGLKVDKPAILFREAATIYKRHTRFIRRPAVKLWSARNIFYLTLMSDFLSRIFLWLIFHFDFLFLSADSLFVQFFRDIELLWADTGEVRRAHTV